MRTGLLLVGILMLIAGRGLGQDWNWPEDKLTAVEKNAMYTDYLADKDYESCVEPLNWLLVEAPELNPSIYINAVKIYQGLAEQTADPGEKLAYQQKALKMHDLRIQYFGQEQQVLNRKAFAAYKFYKDNPAQYEALLSLFDETFEKSGNKAFNNNLVAYMDVIRRYKKAGGDISDEEVMLRYTNIAEVINFKKEKGDNIERIANNVYKLLASTITIDCQTVENAFGSKLRSNPEDVDMAKRVFQLLLTGKCSESDLFLESAEIINEQQPSFAMAKVIAAKSSAQRDTEKAMMYYRQAEDMAKNNEQRGDVLLDMAKLSAANGQKIKARSQARKALTYNKGLWEAYALIGNLYMNSYEDCRQGVSKVQDRAIFIAAYKMYEVAGYQVGMENAMEQFPSIEEIFELNMEEGQEVTVGCWVNETVKLSRRPNQ